MNGDLRLPLAEVRRVEHHQATMVNWLLGADHSLIETTIGYEQVAIEVTAALAQQEPDAYLAQAYRFGLLEDFDHMHRFSALLDRLEGKDSNNILQSYTDVLPGRPTSSSIARRRTICAGHSIARPRAVDEAQRAHARRSRAADAQLLHEHRSVVRRPARTTAVRGDRLDRATARDALRVAARSAAVAPGELADARGDGGVHVLQLRAAGTQLRGSRRSGNGCSATSWVISTWSRSCSRSTSVAIHRRSSAVSCLSRFRSKASVSSCERRSPRSRPARQRCGFVDLEAGTAKLARLSQLHELGGLTVRDRRGGLHVAARHGTDS